MGIDDNAASRPVDDAIEDALLDYFDQEDAGDFDYSLVAEELNRIDIENCPPISIPVRPSEELLDPSYTDDELIPMSPVDLLFSQFSYSADEALDHAATRPWLLDGILPSGGFGAIYGKEGSYKSFIALDMGCAIASGRPWHGVDCDNPGVVIYIAAEGSYGLQQRKKAWEVHYSVDLTAKLVVLPMPVMIGDLIAAQHFIEASKKVEEDIGQPVKMIVIDTFARTFSGDENSSKETGDWINAAGRVSRELDECTVMIVTHTTKAAGGGIRGSSAIAGASDFVYQVKRPPNSKLKALLINDKQKDTDEAEPMLFAMDRVAIGRKDRKGRDMYSLIPELEYRGKDADPDAEDEDEGFTPPGAPVDAFDAKDVQTVVGLVRAASVSGAKITETQCRHEFVADVISGGLKRNSANKKWRSAFARAVDGGMIYKKGAHLYLGDGKQRKGK